MLLVLKTMKDDLEHRKKYLKVESCMNEIVCCTRESSCTREWKLTGKELKAILSYYIPPNGHVIIQIGLTLGVQPKDMIMEKEHIFFPNGCLVQNNASNLKARTTVFDFPTKAEKLLLKIVS